MVGWLGGGGGGAVSVQHPQLPPNPVFSFSCKPCVAIPISGPRPPAFCAAWCGASHGAADHNRVNLRNGARFHVHRRYELPRPLGTTHPRPTWSTPPAPPCSRIVTSRHSMVASSSREWPGESCTAGVRFSPGLQSKRWRCGSDHIVLVHFSRVSRAPPCTPFAPGQTCSTKCPC